MSVLYNPRAGMTASEIKFANASKAVHSRIAAAAAALPLEPAPASLPVVKSVAPRVAAAPTQGAMSRHQDLNGSPLNPRHTFATMVFGRSNALAHAAALQVAEGGPKDPVIYNPLYIHGDVGLGKTHLLHAMTWAGNLRPDRKVLYLSAEKFMYGFVAALKHRTASAFREALRGIDVIAVDDLQFLIGKYSQSEIGSILGMLIDAGRQVVVAADRPPADIEGADARLISRLSAGLVVEIAPPGKEQRLQILQHHVAAARAHCANFEIADPILDFLAVSIVNNGRDLEAIVNRLAAHSKFTTAAVTMELAEKQARDLIRPPTQRRVTVEDVQRLVSRTYCVSRSDLMSAQRMATIVRPRQVAMYLAKTVTLRSLPEIGRRFGGRDHTTVLHAVRKIEGLILKDSALADEIEHFKTQLVEG